MEAISILNMMKFNVVEFTNPSTSKQEYFIFDTFTPDSDLGSRRMMKHAVAGKDITKLLLERSTVLSVSSYKVAEAGLRDLINNLPVIKLEFSHQYLWKLYLAI
jgi:hypothetical protein